jgi:S-adenosylmethionine hydrolase
VAPAFVMFLTDYGLEDDFVGTCHGVIARIAPEARIIDVAHGLEPGSVLQGALVLAKTLRFMPDGVHLAVVDPGVGSSRRPVVLRDAGGRLFVGPDNGLLVPAAERAGAIAAAYELAEPAYALQPVSRTFHGRDLFAPAAAHLANGVEPAELGPPLDPATLVRLALPHPEVYTSRINATVLAVDRFGNVALNLARADLDACGIGAAAQVELEVRGDRYLAVAARTFSDARTGDLVLFEDSWGDVAVAVSSGDAAQLLRVRPGDELLVRAEAL